MVCADGRTRGYLRLGQLLLAFGDGQASETDALQPNKRREKRGEKLDPLPSSYGNQSDIKAREKQLAQTWRQRDETSTGSRREVS
eukprot:669194-Rhodomonas_salina.2